jgi:hypothetical protein
MTPPGETEAGHAGMQPCRGITWRAHRDDDRQRGNQSLALLPSLIGSKDPDALKSPPPRAEYSLTGSASSPVQAEPRHMGSPWNHRSRLSTAPFSIAARRRADATLQSNIMKAVWLTSNSWGARITKRYRSCDEKRKRIETHSGQASTHEVPTW